VPGQKIFFGKEYCKAGGKLGMEIAPQQINFHKKKEK